MNSVALIGRLTKDPEVRYSSGNQQMAVARFSIAVDRPFAKQGEQSADFINIVCFGKTAEFIEKYFNKGKQIGITGRIQTGSYEKDGRKIYTTDVVADRVEFVGSKDGRSDNGASAPQGFGNSEADNQVPAGFEKLTDDDIPF